MAAVALPTSPGPVEAKPRFLDWGGELVPALGGPVQRLSRLGSRHAVEFVLPPMTMASAMAWTQRLKRGKNDRVLIPYPLMGFAPGSSGTPTIRTAASGGTTIDIRGVSRSHTLSEGQSLSIVVGGKRYVYSCDNAETAIGAAAGYTVHANATILDLGGSTYRIEKTAGGATWDASVYASISFPGDFLARCRPVQTNADFMFGVDPSPTDGASYTHIDRVLHFSSGGTVTPYEAGVPGTGLGAYTAAQYWFIRRLGTAVEVLRGLTTEVDNATLVHTFTAHSSALFVDSSLNTLNGQFEVYAEHYYHGTVEITPQLRTAVAIGDTVEIETPYIEGYLEGDETSWTLEAARTVGLAFTVVEAE